jgi:iron-regulated transporter 1
MLHPTTTTPPTPHTLNRYLAKPNKSYATVLLYFNDVLSPGGLMTAFLTQIGCNGTNTALFRSGCAVLVGHTAYAANVLASTPFDIDLLLLVVLSFILALLCLLLILPPPLPHLLVQPLYPLLLLLLLLLLLVPLMVLLLQLIMAMFINPML